MSASSKNAELLQWIKQYRDMVAPLLPAAVSIPLEAALRTVEYANKSTSFGDMDWGGPAQRARNWFMGHDGKVWELFP